MTAPAPPAHDAARRADAIRTKQQAIGAFVAQPSGRVLLAAASVLLIARGVAGQASTSDLLVLAMVLLLVGPFEWVVHRSLLHAPVESRRMRLLGTGRGHLEHHRDPAELRWLMLCWRDALIFTVALGAIAGVLATPVVILVDAPLVGTWLTAWSLAALGLLHYEWTHLLVHTRYRCRSRYYRALERHHRLHHYRDERKWLGVTSRLGDRLLGTADASR